MPIPKIQGSRSLPKSIVLLFLRNVGGVSEALAIRACDVDLVSQEIRIATLKRPVSQNAVYATPQRAASKLANSSPASDDVPTDEPVASNETEPPQTGHVGESLVGNLRARVRPPRITACPPEQRTGAVAIADSIEHPLKARSWGSASKSEGMLGSHSASRTTPTRAGGSSGPEDSASSHSAVTTRRS